MTRHDAFIYTVALGIAAMCLSYALSFVTEALARRFGAVDQPTGGRKIHQKPMPLWGGLGIAVTLILGIVFARSAGVLVENVRVMQLIGFVGGVVILLIGGMIDDLFPQPPRVQILFPVLAALSVVVSGTKIIQITQPGGGGFNLVWWTAGPFAFPSDALTFVWLLLATYATKIQDGLDGLVTGLACIGAGLVAALSLSVAFFQPAIAVLSGVVGGSFFGFLPKNAYPAKQFLGESGGVIAGFSVGVLAILSSAKIAIALAVLAIPITDVVLVIIGRVRRGVPWYKGDSTHLHFRLLQAGLSQRVVVLLLWGISLGAGLLALTLQTGGKVFLIGALVLCTALASYIAGSRTRRSTT